ncbi:hypothetical protein HMPREF0497_0904 [Lentilactobacillus buchneri ATCC 11577]|nr:hypothetical protein HMPREF0497_0904 [Lentilactobacillus buchneri ATCC 11577]
MAGDLCFVLSTVRFNFLSSTALTPQVMVLLKFEVIQPEKMVESVKIN